MDFINAALALPTGFFTLFLVIALIYWLFVIIGAFDIDFLNFGDGAADGVLDAGAEGIAEGAADGIAEGAAEGAADGVADGAAEAAGKAAAEGSASVLAGLFAALRLRSAPVTVVLSLIFLFGWMISFFSMQALGGLGLGGFFVGAGVGLGALLLALPITAAAVRPLAPIFEPAHARRRSALLGNTCTLATGRVTATFGQANVVVDRDHLLVQVRCRRPNGLTKGDEALIVDFDPERETYIIEPLGGDR
ncbi:MAG: glycine zipper family protein [bacterium]